MYVTLNVIIGVYVYVFLCDAIILISTLQREIPFPTNIHGVKRDKI
jgi:hypothetical protein